MKNQICIGVPTYNGENTLGKTLMPLSNKVLKISQ